jgi:hypothetical protein
VTSIPAQSSDRVDDAGASTRDLADLARSGYEILQEPFTHVYFEVHHTADRPGYFRDHVFVSRDQSPSDGGGDDETSIAVEALVSAANGVGLVIGTNRGLDVLRRPSPAGGAGIAAYTVADDRARRVFRGTALPNPTFLFESALTYEGILAIEPAPRSLRFNMSIAVRDLIKEISRVAADVAKAPLLFLQCPAQLPDHVFVSQDVRSRKITTPKRSSALAVRFAIALSHPSASLRFELTDIIMRYCSERRFGFWLADTRIGYRSGNWFQICVYEDDLSRQERRERAASPDSRTVDSCVPVTFIGPARIGSTYNLMSFLCQFNNIGVISASNTTLDDLAFIHLQLSFAGLRRAGLDALNRRLADRSSWIANPLEAIRHINRIVSPSDDESAPYIYEGDNAGRVGDYQTLIGPALGCAMPDRRRRIAVWFSWQMEGAGDDLAMPMAELFSSLSDIGLATTESAAAHDSVGLANLEYLIFRDVGNSVLRGRGKFSVTEEDILQIFHENVLESAAVKLCMGLEDGWATSLRRRGVRGVSELTVSWREWWLGHWASPI